MARPWWERYPERYEYELSALADAGMTYARDDDAFSRGFLRLSVELELNGERLHLRVTFPDLYPYFRFEVEAPTLSLAHHQNPFQKNLCLMGRGTHYWHTSDTLAKVLQQQLPTVIATGNAADAEATRGLEQQQAEPFSDYYPTAPGGVVLPGNVVIPDAHRHGTFRIATDGAQGPPSEERFLRGVLASLRGQDGQVLAEAPPELMHGFNGSDIEGCWARLPTPIAIGHQPEFLKELLRQVPAVRAARINRVPGGYLQAWGVAFPEETSWRETDGIGWVFVCLFSRSRDEMVHTGPPAPTAKGKTKRRGNGKKRRGKGKRTRGRRR